MRRRVANLLALLIAYPLSATAQPASAQATRPASVTPAVEVPSVTPVPDAVRTRLKLSAFYAQHCDAGGLSIVASKRVNPFALREAAFLIDQMLTGRDDVRRAMVESGVRFSVMAVTERTTDVPEHSDLTPKDYWDRRARGLGATRHRPSVSCGEENLLALRGDPYATENILIHEFAHAIHEMGLNAVDATFQGRLDEAFKAAKAEGLWKGTYAMTNAAEYWAEGTQSWFDTNRSNDSSHGEVDTRDEVKSYDPRLAALLAEMYGDRPWRYVRPDRRSPASEHLAGLDRSTLPAFDWNVRIGGPGSATTGPATRPRP